MGVVFFVYNAAFSTVLLILVLIASFYALFSKNPDTRYQPMRDDRGSFIKSQSELTTELDALGATARGEPKHGFYGNKGARIEEDDSSLSGSDTAKNHMTTTTSYTGAGTYYPAEDQGGRHNPPSPYYQSPARQPGSADGSRAASMTRGGYRNQTTSPSPWQRGAGYD